MQFSFGVLYTDLVTHLGPDKTIAASEYRWPYCDLVTHLGQDKTIAASVYR